MNIYIDFDDCLCETARFLAEASKRLFDKNVLYEDMHSFDLKVSFSLTDEQYEHLMSAAHSPDALLRYDETPGACRVVNSWVDAGDNVTVITGRPTGAYEASRQWLDDHGLDRVKLYCLNKYGRSDFSKSSPWGLEIEDYMKMHFDMAVEDSPMAFKYFEHLRGIRVMVFDRPWNAKTVLPDERFARCGGWDMIEAMTKERAV